MDDHATRECGCRAAAQGRKRKRRKRSGVYVAGVCGDGEKASLLGDSGYMKLPG